MRAITLASIALWVLFTVMLFSCNQLSENKKLELRSVNSSFEKSNAAINSTNQELYRKFEEIKIDYISKDRALKWEPVVKFVANSSGVMVNLLDSFSLSVNNEKGTVKQINIPENIFQKYNTYKKDILLLNPQLKKEFNNDVFKENEVDTITSLNQFNDIFFKNKTAEEVLVNLKLFKNNVLLFEGDVIRYCINICTPLVDNYRKSSVIVGQSAAILKPGDDLVITAGLGEFSISSGAVFFINGNKVQPQFNEANVTSSIKVSSRPGKYHVPVNIIYIDEAGNKIEKSYNIEYVVADVSTLK